MDDRKQQCKLLKKAYAKERRRAVRGWKLIWFASVLLAVCAGALLAGAVFYDHAVMGALRKHLDLRFLLRYQTQIRAIAPWVILGSVLLWVCAWIGWSVKSRCTRKGAAYLDWRTMKTALEAEEEER